MKVRKERKKKRIFATVILALMTMLAAGAVVFAEGNDSYALTIVKRIDTKGLPDDVLEWARDQEYTFRIDGFGYSRGEVKSFREIFENSSLPAGVEFVEGNDNALLVTIKGEGSQRIDFDTTVAATVSEVTNGLKYDNDGDIWNMSTADCEASMPSKLVEGTNLGTGGSRDLTINIGKDGGKIRVSKPDNAEWTGYFRPKKKEESGAGRSGQSGLSGWGGDFPVRKVSPGETVEWEDLRQGSYIVEKLEGPKGFSAYLGERAASVSQGGEGTININGNYGKLTITAPGTPGGSEQYYYVISGEIQVEDENGGTHSETYERVTNAVKAGDTYVMDHLPKGLLTVKEYNYSPSQGFSVTGVNVSERVKTLTTKINSSKLNTWRWVDNLPEDIIDNAQVQISQIKGPKKGTSVKFGIGGTWSDKPEEEVRWNYVCTVGTPRKIETRYMLPGSRILLNWNGNADITQVETKYYYKREMELTNFFEQSDTFYTKTISQDWLEISKEEDNTPEGEIYYYYTILDKDGNPITGYSVSKNGVPVSGSEATDREGTVVRMKSGDTVRLEGLQPGSYRIQETIDADKPEPFQMVVEETESTASSFGEVDVKVLGSRTLTITKDKDQPGMELPELLYRFQISGPGVEEEIRLKAGESREILLPQEGDYKVTELDRNEIFELSYTDSGTVGIMTTTKAFSSRSFLGRSADEEGPDTSTVTFTNSFSREEGAYRVIHEYYLRHRDGTYECEGSSTLSSVGGLRLHNKYTDADVVTQNIFYGQPYTYFQSAYGQAAIIDAGEEGASGETARLRRATPSNIATESNITALSNGVARINANAGSRSLRAELSSMGTGSGESTEPDEARPARIASPSNQERILSDEEEADEEEPENDVELVDDLELINDIEPEDEPELAYTLATPSGTAEIRSLQEEIMPLPSDEGIDDEESDFDGGGIISRGVVVSGGKRLAYEPEEDKDHVEATKEGNQVIILRYYREDEAITGNYKVLHVYYLRNETGDIREGTSEIIDTESIELTEDTRKELHTVKEVEQLPHPFEYHDKKGDPVECLYEYTYDGCAYGKVISGGEESSDFYIFGDTYRPDDSREGVYATEAGDQIIILRYYRKVNPINRTGSYKVVHEYYYQEPIDSGQSGEDEEDGSPDTETERAGRRLRAGTSETEEGEGGESVFGGTLIADRDYSYTFEGMTEIENISAPLGHEVYAEMIQKKTGYTPADGERHNYTYYDAGYGETMDVGYYEWMPNKQWAASTEEGKQIVILRYVRSDEKPTEPTEPEKPTEPTEPEKPTEPTKPEKPTDPTVPESPTAPTEPESPTDPTKPESPTNPTEPESPTDPTRPTRPSGGGGGGGGGGGRDPVPPTEPVPESPTETPAETPAVQSPETPAAPSDPSDSAYPRELPDPQDPNSPERITIWEDGVPRTYYKVWDPETESYVYLPEEDVPLSARGLPQTGDSRGMEFWKTMFFVSLACGIIPLMIVRRREKRKRH